MFEKYFVPAKIAEALRGAGFDEPTIARPGMFEPKRHNSVLPRWLYAAPLYQQVFDWFLAKGIYLHDYRVPDILNNGKPYWGVNVFDMQGNQLWPHEPFDELYCERVKLYHHDTQQKAWDQAIPAAIEIIKTYGQ